MCEKGGLPDKTMCLKGEKGQAERSRKTINTDVLPQHMAVDCEKLLLIGKSANPRYFREAHLDTLQVE